jgi:hypothetical protein
MNVKSTFKIYRQKKKVMKKLKCYREDIKKLKERIKLITRSIKNWK